MAKQTIAQTTESAQALLDRIAQLEAENAKLKTSAPATGRISFKVSEKGAVSVYGMGRWPVTLYAEQWGTLMSDDTRGQLAAFIEAHKGQLSTREQRDARKADQPATTPTTDGPRLVDNRAK